MATTDREAGLQLVIVSVHNTTVWSESEREKIGKKVNREKDPFTFWVLKGFDYLLSTHNRYSNMLHRQTVSNARTRRPAGI